MFWFVLCFFFIYFVMHLYLYLKIKNFIKSIKIKKFLFFIFVFLVFSPLLIRYTDEYASSYISYLTSLGVLFWMGYLIYIIFFYFFYDIFKILIKKFLFFQFSKKQEFITLTFISLGFSIYSYLETYQLELIRLIIETNKISENTKKIKILQISDIHLGPVIGKNKIELVKKVWMKEKPDLILSTGDLVDGNMRKKDDLAEELREITAPMGKYAILGNHEYYRGVKQSIEFTKKAGFTVLRNEVIKVIDNLYIAGFDDKTCRFFDLCEKDFKEIDLLKNIPKDGFVLIMKHQPEIKRETIGYFDLMLSGHTHGGLYRGLGAMLMKKIYGIDRGIKYLGKGSYIFVSKGIGTGGPPMRFFTLPDMVIIEIVGCKKCSNNLKLKIYENRKI